MLRQRISLERLEITGKKQWRHQEGTGTDQSAATRLLRKAIEQELTPRQQQCVELYFFQRLTMEQTGDALGINKATVCRHLHKALKRLERALAYAGYS